MELSPCQFAIYDSDGDGLVTLEEFNNVYNDYLANNLMKALDEDRKFNDVLTLNCRPKPRLTTVISYVKQKKWHLIETYESQNCFVYSESFV